MNENGKPVNWFMKFLQFPVTRIILGFLVLITVASLAQVGTETLLGEETIAVNFLATLITAGSAFLAYYAFVRLVERRTVKELSLPQSLVELPFGLLIGAALFSVTIAILWLLGNYHVSGMNEWGSVANWLMIGILSGVIEELLVRGILFRVMEEYLGTWISLAISALIFGAMHLANPNATLWAGAAIAIEAGILLAASYVYRRRLWIPIGIHIAWNFTQGGIFGVSVSGIKAQGLLQSTLSGSTLLSGGEFGAEASIFAVLVCLSAGIYFLWKAYQQGSFIKPFWMRSVSDQSVELSEMAVSQN